VTIIRQNSKKSAIDLYSKFVILQIKSFTVITVDTKVYKIEVMTDRQTDGDRRILSSISEQET